jgi:TRAP transporter 4TM/12TM fusion protein
MTEMRLGIAAMGGDFALRVIFAAFAIFQIYTTWNGLYEPLIQRGLFVGFGLGSVFLLSAVDGLRKGRPFWPWFDAVLAIVGYWVCLHVVLSNDRLSNFMVELTNWDIVLGIVAIVLLLEGARRTIGWFLPLLVFVGLLYFFFGHELVSGAWQPPRVSLLTAVESMYASTQAIFGYMADVGTRVIAIFIILGALLLSTGATEIFMKMATLIAGRSYGGQAKVCTISSALFGTVTGSAVANVMAVGSVTIPTMRRAGYTPAFAAAVEAVASAGGQIMPPVMGAGAFIMAEILNIPYSHVVLAAIIPAVLYYLTLWFSVGLQARRSKIQPLTAEEMPDWRDLLDPYTALPMYLPVAVLTGMLILDYTPTRAGAAAVLLLIASQLILRVLRCLLAGRPNEVPAALRTLAMQLVDGLVDAGKAIVMISVLLACAALVVKVLTATGAGVKISGLILSVSSDGLAVVLVLTAILSILLGMDVPTTASYILASAVAAPAVIKLGVPDLNAHLFVFYYAIMSAITPPVCASVFAAASIANVSFWRVAGHAVVMAIALYLIPFLFIYRPGVLLQGDPLQIAYDVIVCVAAIFVITAASAGYLRGVLRWPLRGALYLSGACFFYVGVWSDLAGAVLLTAVFAVQYRFGERAVRPIADRAEPSSAADRVH